MGLVMELVGEFAPGSLPITYPGDDNMAFGMNFPANSNGISDALPCWIFRMVDSTQVHFISIQTRLINLKMK